jgi:hypothetical protein
VDVGPESIEERSGAAVGRQGHRAALAEQLRHAGERADRGVEVADGAIREGSRARMDVLDQFQPVVAIGTPDRRA